MKKEDGYELKAIQKKDMEKIRIARNEQIDVLRQKKEISKEEQELYFEHVIKPNLLKKNPEMILFSFFKNEVWIGYGGLVHIDFEHKRAEISFLVDSSRANNPKIYRSDFSHFLSLIADFAFHDLKFHRIFTETYDFRHEHIKILEDFGFKYEGTMREHLFVKNSPCDSHLHGLLSYELSS